MFEIHRHAPDFKYHLEMINSACLSPYSLTFSHTDWYYRANIMSTLYNYCQTMYKKMLDLADIKTNSKVVDFSTI